MIEEWMLPVLATAVIVGVIVLFAKEKSDEPGTDIASDPSPQNERSEARETPAISANSPYEIWRIWGLLLTIGGGAGFAFSLLMETTVESYASGILGSGGSSSIVNIGLLFQKGTALAASLSAIGIGVFCLAVSAILLAIDGLRRGE